MPDATPTAAPTTPAPAAEPTRTAADLTPVTDAPGSATPAETGEPTPKPTHPKPPEPRRLKLKVNGEDVELEESEVIRRAQKAEAVERKFEELAKARKDLEAREAALKAPYADPRVKELVLKNGWTEKKAAAFLEVQELYEQEQRTPEQRAFIEEQTRRKELEAKLAEQEKAQSEAKLTAEVQRHRAQFEKAIPEAAEKAGLPRTPHAGRLVVEQLQRQARMRLEPDVEDAAIAARETLNAEIKAVLGGMSDAQLEKYLGDHAERLRKYQVSKVRGTEKAPEVAPLTPNGTNGKAAPGKPWYMSPDDFREKFRP